MTMSASSPNEPSAQWTGVPSSASSTSSTVFQGQATERRRRGEERSEAEARREQREIDQEIVASERAVAEQADAGEPPDDDRASPA
jgi:hypothetical protein